MRILKALTIRAKKWVDGNVHYDNSQLVNGGIAGDWRMIDQIGEAMRDEGFVEYLDFAIL